MQCLRKVRSHEVSLQPNEQVLTWGAFEKEPRQLLGCVVGRYGEKFVWTEKHLTKEQLDPLRMQGDDMKEFDEIPHWVNFSQVSAGQRVMLKYLPYVGISLFYVSLVGGFSAAVITKTLRRAGGLTGSRQHVFERLLRTSEFVMKIALLDPKPPHGEAYLAAKQVRSIHHQVRKRLLKEQNSGEVPINQEDNAVTLLAFSYNVLVGTELLRGKPLTIQEQEQFLHLWRWIGFCLGVQLDVCANVATAKASLESIIMHILEPDDHSIALAHHVLRAPPSFIFPRFAFAFRAQLCRLLLGPGLADALHLPNHPLYSPSRLCVVGIQLACQTYSIFLDLPLIGSILLSLHTRLASHLLLLSSKKRKSKINKGNALQSDCPMSFS